MNEHRMDTKGRIVLPAKLRERLGDVVFVTKGIEGCLTLYSQEAWNDLQEKIKEVSYFSLSLQARNALRIIMDAEEINLDTAGRILLPAELREYARLGQDVKFIKISSQIEIWDAQIWKDREKATLENLSELGNLSDLAKELGI